MEDLPRIVTAQQAYALGLTPDAIKHRVGRGWWLRLHHGVYFTRGVSPTAHDRLAGALESAGPGAALSGAAALMQWALRDVAMPARPLVLVPASSAATPSARVLVRRTAVPYVAHWRNDLRVVRISRALVDHCVTVRRRDSVLALVSEVIRLRLCTVDDLVAAYRTGPRRGSAHLRRALEDVSAGAWSVPEGHLGRALRAAAVPAFQQNVPIRSTAGELVGIVDVWWPDLRAALEVQGAKDHSSPVAWTETVRRASRLEEIGVSVMHVPAIDVLRDLDGVVRRVRSWLEHLDRRRAA
jgi:very-short-patch-repair endonuclease